MSFQKSRQKVPVIPGTKIATRNSQLLLSTGIPSLDNFIGGGLPASSILFVEEDTYGVHSKVISKYFMAEGIASDHSLFVASQDSNPKEFSYDLPALAGNPSSIDNKNSSETERMKIAWRYEDMKVADLSLDTNVTFGHNFDLTKKLSKEIIDSANVTCWDGNNVESKTNIFYNNAFSELLYEINKNLTKEEFSIETVSKKKNLLRIVIHSLGSRIWMTDLEERLQTDLVKFFYILRCLLRKAYAVAIVTVPVENYNNMNNVIERLEHLSDVAISLESFAGSCKETNPIFKGYHGLLHLKKLHTLVSQDSLLTDLVYKLRRKKFVIEILHLPPELANSTQREQDDAATISSSCNKLSNKLDF